MTHSSSICLLLVVVTVLALGITMGLPREGNSKPRNEPLVNCHPDPGENEETCSQRRCLWEDPETENAPWCTYPLGSGYRVEQGPEDTTLGWRVILTRIARPSLFGNDLETIQLDVEFYRDTMVKVTISDAAGDRPGDRYQVPNEAVNIHRPSSPANDVTRLYDVIFEDQPQFGIKVIRRTTGTVVFDTTLPGLTFSDQYLQLTTRLPSAAVYGFGEHNHMQFQHNMDWRNWTIFTRDNWLDDERRHMYGHQTLYMNLEDTSHANAVYLHNSNAMDVVLQPLPNPGISYHVIGGVLDFYIFLGPSPENIVQQYTAALGRPMMPPYWSLGFQLSRWDYNNLTHVRNVVNRNIEAGIPLDVQYGDVDYMQHKYLFTYDKSAYDGLPEFVDELHQMGMKYIIILDHAVGSNQTIIDEELNGKYLPCTDGVDMDIFIKDPRNMTQYLQGEVWPGIVYYPDFTNLAETKDWWLKQCIDFYEGSDWGVHYDALWIDMNEPSNFVQGSTTGCNDSSTLNHPPYLPNVIGGLMYDKTICMDSPQTWGLHYDVHSLYGHSMAMVTWTALREQFADDRPLVLTRSQFAGSQSYAAHWLGDNQSKWPHLGYSIIGMLEYSLFGFSYTGSDICGFMYETTEEMCQRWHQLGAFYPFARNHNAELWPDQDPGSPIFTDELRRVTRDVLMTRYKLLPFLYTLLHQAHIYGSTVVRPLLHEFLEDDKTWTIDEQFLWGPSFMVSPALQERQRRVDVYFPNTRWYDYYTGAEVMGTGRTLQLETPMDKINLHVRGGHIIPWQTPATTTVYSRTNPMGLLVALGDEPEFAAHGSLFWDDGHSYDTYGSGEYLQVEFNCSQINTDYELQMSPVHNGPNSAADGLIFSTINVYGLDAQPDSISVDGVDHLDYQFDSNYKVLDIINLNLDITSEHLLIWTIIY